MITIKGVTISTVKEIRVLMGSDAIRSVAPYDTPPLHIVILSDDVMLTSHNKGFIVLNRGGNVVALTNDDYVEITID